jgi:chromosome segregation protein
MLKRLELVGFKSFADKTTFDFGGGITAIVGPNGSGKSNIVDAVRWILGEQSAKSLRGGEMADVIFNGSTTRRGLGMAEVTLTFDNRKHALAIESEEVQITRRVYRDGEGEYLINQQPTRLKDIKELFLGSGAGGDAYCVIEQGRVDSLLQSSTQDRRGIFEEAAGISRFKAKKTETLRKLERVDQNLQRLRDVIEEVGKQLRSVRLQASKAQRYQEYSTRLQRLRVALGALEFRQLGDKLAAESTALAQLKAQLAERAQTTLAWETEMERLEAALGVAEDALRHQEARLAHAREQIKANQTTLNHESSLANELESELSRHRANGLEHAGRLGELANAVAVARVQMEAAEAQAAGQRGRVHELEQNARKIAEGLANLRMQLQHGKTSHLEQMRRTARLQNDAVAFKAQTDNLTRERQRLHQKAEQAVETLATLDLELQELTEADFALQARLAADRQALAGMRAERDRLRAAQDATTESVSRLRQQRSGLQARVDVLDELERSQEGLGSGVREVLDQLRQAGSGPWSGVAGMIADFLSVRREYAALIDLALGDWSQRFLVRDTSLLAEALAQRGRPLSGRVSFLPLAPATEGAEPALLASSPPGAASVPAHPGFVALAQNLVTCDHPSYAHLPAQLLGRTLVVRDLGAARAIAAESSAFRFVTLDGELLEQDGTLTVGAHRAETGILSRKSELRDLASQLAEVDSQLRAAEQALTELRDQAAGLDDRLADKQDELDVLAEQAADLRARIERHRDKRQGLHEEVTVSRDEIMRMQQEIEVLTDSWQKAQKEAAEAEAQMQALQQQIERAEATIREVEHDRQARQDQATQAAIALGKAEERLAGVRAQHTRLASDLRQRQQEAAQAEQALRDCKTRLAYSQLTRLNASASLAHGYREKETAEHEAARLGQERQQFRQERMRLANEVQTLRNAYRSQHEEAHARELAVNDLKHQQSTLADRIREDYQVDLAAQASAPAAPAESEGAVVPERAAEEIAELRHKLAKLGAVNLDALQELQEFETRETELQKQFDDLAAAKRSLDEIIGKINLDSRKLFSETLSIVRTHFQELFRKLFGGGMADIVLENEADILESGIEIIARPPGKELRSISLMSGGEKTLTAVALLLAMFRSRPSPFCLLDEVDAALDEANIARFTAVIREFLDLSQFIIITHSKKTMACADVLYGVTMQESGISKQVAVRFEDWAEDDQPVQPAPAGEAASFAGR